MGKSCGLKITQTKHHSFNKISLLDSTCSYLFIFFISQISIKCYCWRVIIINYIFKYIFVLCILLKQVLVLNSNIQKISYLSAVFPLD